MMSLPSPKFFISFLLMISVGLSVSQIDIYIASLPYMVDYFQSTQEMLQFTLSASVLGTSLVTLFIGQLSDAIGRRRLIVWFHSFYTFFLFAAAFSPSIEIFILSRFLMGCFSCAAVVLSFAVIADLFE